jgi:hypothetical protein
LQDQASARSQERVSSMSNVKSTALTRAEINAIKVALGFALAGEPDEWSGYVVDCMRSAQAKFSAMERTTATLLPLTSPQAVAISGAVNQMTDGNARDFAAWHSQTHGTWMTWQALLVGEARLRQATANGNKRKAIP